MRVIAGLSGSSGEVGCAAEEIRRLIGQGAGVVFLDAGAGNAAALEALREGRGTWYIIGRLFEENAVQLSMSALAFVVKGADRAVYEICEAVAVGRFRSGETVVYDLENRGVDITDVYDFFDGADYKGPWPLSEIRRRLDELRGEIIRGGIRVKSLRDRTLCNCR
jgi:basic membrane protein A